MERKGANERANERTSERAGNERSERAGSELRREQRGTELRAYSLLLSRSFNFTSKADLADSKVDLSFDLYPALPPNLDDVEIVIENGNIERTSRPARLSVVGPVEGGERGGKGNGGEGGDGVGSQRDLAYLTVNQT
jgi:hypothetical protein